MLYKAYPIQENQIRKASDKVWALVAGLPRGKRERRLIMALTAFLDDSGSEPQSEHFVLAGFVSAAEQWAVIADEWQSICDAAPRIEYFKMAEAMGLRGQFGGWSREDRDKKVIALSEVIPRSTVIQICAVMRNEDFSETIKKLRIYKAQRELMYEHPYLLLWWTLLQKFYPQWLRMGFQEPVNFIFDRQLGFEVPAIALWQSMLQFAKTSLAPEFYNLLSGSPRFEDDKDVVPLQLADMHAWAIRRQLSRGDTIDKMPVEAIRNFERPNVHPMTLTVTREWLEATAHNLQAGHEAMRAASSGEAPS